MVTVDYKQPTKSERRAMTLDEIGLTQVEDQYIDSQGRGYSNVWFHRDTKPLWDALYRAGVWPGKKCESYLEIGVCEAASLCWVLDHASSTFDNAFCLDPYKAGKQHKQSQFDQYEKNAALNIALHDLSSTVFHMKKPSTEGLATLLSMNSEFDAIYIDGDHNAPQAIFDMVVSWEMLNVGGIMIVDDLHRRWHLGKPHVHEAVRAFCETHEKRMDIVHRSARQIAMRRTA